MFVPAVRSSRCQFNCWPGALWKGAEAFRGVKRGYKRREEAEGLTRPDLTGLNLILPPTPTCFDLGFTGDHL